MAAQAIPVPQALSWMRASGKNRIQSWRGDWVRGRVVDMTFLRVSESMACREERIGGLGVGVNLPLGKGSRNGTIASAIARVAPPARIS